MSIVVYGRIFQMIFLKKHLGVSFYVSESFVSVYVMHQVRTLLL